MQNHADGRQIWLFHFGSFGNVSPKGPKGDKGDKIMSQNSTLRPKLHVEDQKRAGVHVHVMKTMLQAAKSGYFHFWSF